MRKSVSIFALLLFLSIGMFNCSQFSNFVYANFSFPTIPSHSIEITKDGNVSGTNSIQRNDNIYIFTEDIIGNIVIFSNDIIIDGDGYTLLGNGSGTGIWLQEKNNVEIKNLHVRNFHNGMIFTWGNTGTGCKNITLSRNTITDNQYGVTFRVSENNHLMGNTIANNTYGITITPSPNNTFKNNQLTNNLHSLWFECTETVGVANYVNDIDESNIIDGKPIIYWVNQQNKTVPSNAGYVALINCKNITVQNLILTNNSPGIMLVATNNSHVTKNHITSALSPRGYGIVLFALDKQCIGNTITENNITSNIHGILSWKSENTIITKNTISNNQENGIYLFGCKNTIISENIITANHLNGIYIWGDTSLGFSSNNTLSDNQIRNNKNGILIESASNMKILGNIIKSNSGWGLILNYLGYNSFSNNTIYHNDFFNNQQVLYDDDDEPARDIWNNGEEGNYWSDYNGTDNDGDGIGDTPYIINEENQDNYPLMNQLDIGIIPEFPSWTILPIFLSVTFFVIVFKKKLFQNP
ncbi:hypothetical protein AC477_02625 [miscellaneous Crenarchaeota group-1 archaeon SG8-32-1]|uniref:Periplasmic copper-binding protein NosD beta helix domain-containing protein n=1 Tax=miscellaneous Crenarchaeota group-1 archaeon SG8-32-1 TaxID=1685124 RepID=A0A0M0BVM9_9ARCH|nr:MAG: hypothetical protein AC477_02625 [miscellaneous Crenarchaeota group-1 archaeon SG8-32-1]